MFCFYSTHNQKDIKKQIRNILNWHMDCNISLIAIFPENTQIFTIRTEQGQFWTVTIKYLPYDKTFITLT